MELKEYKEKKDKVVEAVKLIRENIKDEATVNFLDEKIKNLENHRFVISIFGHFSNGKSTFLNALMGFSEEILVEDELASTATITRLKYAHTEALKNKAEIIFKDGRVEVVEINEIKKYSARNNEIKDVEDKIAEVVLYLDSEILKDGVEIVDTPGFNSTHYIHTKTAKSHVANSDASIFLFSYDKPGSQKEFNFLRDVNDKMDRIFLVLNKIDMEDKTESTIEDTIIDLKRKINIAGADVKDKFVHPISARLEKQGIAEKDSHKRETARVLEFKKKLADYLTSDDNIRDRLEAPIKSILSKLNECRELKKEQFGIYNTENDKLEQDIARAKSELEELENDLKERKKSIRKLVKSEINNSRNFIESEAGKLEQGVDEDLKDVKSSFALRITDFSNMTENITSKIKNTVDGTQKKLIRKFEEIIDLYIDDQKDFDMIKGKLVNAIEVKLNIDGKSVVSINEIDKSYFDDIEEKIAKKKEELSEKRLKWERLARESSENDELRQEVERQRRALERLENEKRDRILQVGEGQVYRDKRLRTERVSRDGLFGKGIDFFFGKKPVEREYEEYDESEINLKRKQKLDINEEYEEKIKKKESLLREKERDVKGSKILDILQSEAEINFRKEMENFYNGEIDLQKERFNREQELVSVNLRKYKKSIKGYISDLAEETKTSLDMNSGTIYKIIEMALISLERKIETKNEAIENLIFAGKVSPEELDMKIKEISEEIVALNESIDNVRTIRESVV
ncbi:hypothetical protein C1H57_09130 [Clostridium sp. 2-1]|uniref:dynamin family protein n=1 Tax=Clostridium TaxID=1485 RepID=UPI000CDB6DF5|nr:MULTISPECIES: dynamin family protein [Clostridium]MBN7575333.1 dynamin family protein [Clostridium beijerinckii]MBN7580630.1 dynamin family protein [Clostridium beijerinckii]MBN7585097.1 dynamin family protein [Clostridium beijerinckii]MBO0520974.1 dynamin family protein [Clostridium beijerinckii]POO91667.1 hypothetical protein C1H57_09130 [Clostridium sp. 2-1]